MNILPPQYFCNTTFDGHIMIFRYCYGPSNPYSKKDEEGKGKMGSAFQFSKVSLRSLHRSSVLLFRLTSHWPHIATREAGKCSLLVMRVATQIKLEFC